MSCFSIKSIVFAQKSTKVVFLFKSCYRKCTIRRLVGKTKKSPLSFQTNHFRKKTVFIVETKTIINLTFFFDKTTTRIHDVCVCLFRFRQSFFLHHWSKYHLNKYTCWVLVLCFNRKSNGFHKLAHALLKRTHKSNIWHCFVINTNRCGCQNNKQCTSCVK